MCRLVSWVAPTPVTLRSLLGDAAIERLEHLSSVHCHGWGAAWRAGGPSGRLQVTRSALPAHEDTSFRDFADSVAARAAIVHLRMGTPGYGRTVHDNHPFDDGTYALAHNGAVAPGDGIDALLPDGARPAGSTDSERYFLALRAQLERGATVPAAAAAVFELAAAAGLHASSWNSMLLGPGAVHVINHHDLSWVPVDVQLWPELYTDEAVNWPPYFDLRSRTVGATTVVTSSGIVDDVSDWTLLPNESVLSLPFDGSEPHLTAIEPIATVSHAP